MIFVYCQCQHSHAVALSTGGVGQVSRLCSQLEIEDVSFRSRDNALRLKPLHLTPSSPKLDGVGRNIYLTSVSDLSLAEPKA